MAAGQAQSGETTSTQLKTRADKSHGRFAPAFDTHPNAPLKVYTDVSLADGEIGVGIVVKNHCGKILHRHWCLVDGPHSTDLAEARAIRKAMELVDADHVKFYTDSENVPRVLNGNVPLPLDEFEYVTLDCVDRDENFAAHLLARKANPNVKV